MAAGGRGRGPLIGPLAVGGLGFGVRMPAVRRRSKRSAAALDGFVECLLRWTLRYAEVIPRTHAGGVRALEDSERGVRRTGRGAINQAGASSARTFRLCIGRLRVKVEGLDESSSLHVRGAASLDRAGPDPGLCGCARRPESTTVQPRPPGLAKREAPRAPFRPRIHTQRGKPAPSAAEPVAGPAFPHGTWIAVTMAQGCVGPRPTSEPAIHSRPTTPTEPHRAPGPGGPGASCWRRFRVRGGRRGRSR
jgi:hypothetical protein